jgi:hypothetical protein
MAVSSMISGDIGANRGPTTAMEIFKPAPAEASEWVIPADGNQTEMLLSLGSKRIPDPYQPLRFHSLLEDERETFEPVDAPWSGSHALIIKPSARAVLEPLFGNSVQYAPIAGTAYDELYYIHVVKYADVLDLDKSELKRFSSSGRIMRIDRHEFLPCVVEAGPIFKLKAMPRGSLFVTGDVVDAIAG